MDMLKGQVAHRVSSLVKDTNWNSICKPTNSRVNEATYISDLETQIRIWTPQGPRYFIVKVKESY